MTARRSFAQPGANVLELSAPAAAISSNAAMDRPPSSDERLIERFRAGDRDAFTALYRAHSPAVFPFDFYMTGDRLKVSELTQDVFVWLIHHPAGFDPARGGVAAFPGGVGSVSVPSDAGCRCLPIRCCSSRPPTTRSLPGARIRIPRNSNIQEGRCTGCCEPCCEPCREPS